MILKFYDGLDKEQAKQYLFFGRIKKVNVIKNLGEHESFNIELIDVVTPRFLLNATGQVKSYLSLDELKKDYFLITQQHLNEKNIIEKRLGE